MLVAKVASANRASLNAEYLGVRSARFGRGRQQLLTGGARFEPNAARQSPDSVLPARSGRVRSC